MRKIVSAEVIDSDSRHSQIERLASKLFDETEGIKK
jgi:hypothetical protein